MRFLVPLFVFLSVAAFQTALSASLESAEKEETIEKYDGLDQLKKIDQMEFEAAEKEKAVQMNVTEETKDDSRYLEAVQDGSVEEHVEAEGDNSAEGAGNSEVAAAQEESQSESSEETDGRQRREHQEVVTEAVSVMDEANQESSKDLEEKDGQV